MRHPVHPALRGLVTRFRLLEQHLLKRAAASGSRLPGDLAHAWGVLAARRGRIRVAELAREVGWSRRHLVNRFVGEFGLAPRDVARLHRFGVAQTHARSGVPWAEVAASAGYADQAHLAREFRVLAGQSPTQWRAESFPIVQDTAVGEGAG